MIYSSKKGVKRLKKVNRNKNYTYNDDSYIETNTNDEDLNDYQEENYPENKNVNNDNEENEIDENKNNDYKVIDKNSKFKILIIAAICIVLSLSLIIANSVSTRKQVGEKTTVTEETVTSNVTDATTEESSTSEVETVVYNLPPDLSVYGTWQLQENATLKIKFDKSYVYTVDNEDSKSVWTGNHAISVCGEKALTKTGLNARQVRMRYGVPKNKFNIDNFYYICLPYEYVSFDGGKKVEAESDFSDKLVELYLYLYNDKDGNLVAYNYIPRDGESALMDNIVQIKGEEL